jgi:hypothetical protein
MKAETDPEWAAYLNAVSRAVRLPIAPEHRAETIRQLELNAEIARPLLDFQVPEGTDLAPVFRP